MMWLGVPRILDVRRVVGYQWTIPLVAAPEKDPPRRGHCRARSVPRSPRLMLGSRWERIWLGGPGQPLLATAVGWLGGKEIQYVATGARGNGRHDRVGCMRFE
jgi:hypothetical protein